MRSRMSDENAILRRGRMTAGTRCRLLMMRDARIRMFERRNQHLSPLERFAAMADDEQIQRDKAEKVALRRKEGNVSYLIQEIDRNLGSTRCAKRQREEGNASKEVKRHRGKENDHAINDSDLQRRTHRREKTTTRKKRRPVSTMVSIPVTDAVFGSQSLLPTKSTDSRDDRIRPKAHAKRRRSGVAASEAPLQQDQSSSPRFTECSKEHNSKSSKVMVGANYASGDETPADIEHVSNPSPSSDPPNKQGPKNVTPQTKKKRALNDDKKVPIHSASAADSICLSKIGGSPTKPSKREPALRSAASHDDKGPADDSPSKRVHITTEGPRRQRRSKRLSKGRNENHPDIRLRALSTEEANEYESVTTGPRKRVVVEIKEANIELTGEDFSRLRACRWLSDEVLNSFIALINARNAAYVAELECPDIKPNCEAITPELEALAAKMSTTDISGAKSLPGLESANEKGSVDKDEPTVVHAFNGLRPRSHIFNTFFFTRLTQGDRYDYGGVSRWLHRADRSVCQLDLIMFPINVGNIHWVLSAIDIAGRKFLYFDSTGGDDVLNSIDTLRHWLKDEFLNKCGEEAMKKMDIDSWGVEVNPSYMPHQNDYGSCGIFILYTAEYLERGIRPTFHQSDIRVLRQRTALFLNRRALPK